MTTLFSNVFREGMQAFKLDMTHNTSCRNVISIEHHTSDVFVAFWQVLPFRERKNFVRFSYKHIFNSQ